MSFKIKFETGNDAFAGGNKSREFARILSQVSDELKLQKLSIDVVDVVSGFPIRDINGNTIGKWSYTPEGDAE